MSEYDIYYMNMALEQAKICIELGEIPVGAVIVSNKTVISTGMNLRERNHNALAHAEIVAINRACILLKRWRLTGCTMYVTLEPCAMCAGAIVNARLERVVYGASDENMGVVGSVANIFAMPLGHHPRVTTGVLKEECEDILRGFFKNIRK